MRSNRGSRWSTKPSKKATAKEHEWDPAIPRPSLKELKNNLEMLKSEALEAYKMFYKKTSEADDLVREIEKYYGSDWKSIVEPEIQQLGNGLQIVDESMLSPSVVDFDDGEYLCGVGFDEMRNILILKTRIKKEPSYTIYQDIPANLFEELVNASTESRFEVYRSKIRVLETNNHTFWTESEFKAG